MVPQVLVLGGECGQITMELLSLLAEQCVDVAVLAAVRVQLDKAPVGTACDVNATLQPLQESMDRWRAAVQQVAVLDARQHATATVFPVECQRSLDHE